MLHVLESIDALSTIPGPVSLAIGVFDGLHLGHQSVISQAINHAKAKNGSAVVVTFKPHPQRVLRPHDSPLLLTSTRHKILLLKDFGVTNLLLVPFTKQFAETSPEDFIRALHHACHPLDRICVGHEWEFGKNRAGNLTLLQSLGQELDFEVIGVPQVMMHGQSISSTRIRKLVETGQFESAAELLGRDFTILGTVEHGDHVGRTLGFPTANLTTHNEQLPPAGVYAVTATNRQFIHMGVVNIGTRPTFYEKETRHILELHLIDFSANLYDQDIEVTFRKFLRPEQKFNSVPELQAQIEQDVQNAKRFFHGHAHAHLQIPPQR